VSVEVEAPPPSEAAPDDTSIARRERLTIDRSISRDPFFWVRAAALSAYGIGYVWWFRANGLIIDRISVALSVAIFLGCAFAGKPWRRWATLVIDAALYALMWFCYEMTRGAADHLGFPLQVHYARNLDRALFFGTDPNVWIQQRFYDARDVKWYDNVASATYYTHFVFPVLALAVLWAASRVQWVRFMRRFATLLAIACTMFVLIPTAPPWMVASKKYPYRLLEPLSRHTGRGFHDLGFHGYVKGWQKALDWGNAVAAMPSLHASFALFVPAFFLPWIRPRWLKAVVLLFPVMMLASLVYFGEHWVVDGLAGWGVVGLSFLFWNRVERRIRRSRAQRARAAIGDVPALASPLAP
jgi:membrane-associated phospholipid phosphatase